MDVFLRLSGVLLIAGGGLSQFYQSQLYCHRLMPPALTSIVTPCRFPCMLKYDEYSDSIMIRYDPDGTLCGMGRCRGGVCLELQHYMRLESFRRSLSPGSKVSSHEKTEIDEDVWNPLIKTSGHYSTKNILRKESSDRHAVQVFSETANLSSGAGIRTCDSVALSDTQRLWREKRAAPRMSIIAKHKPDGSFNKKNTHVNTGYGVLRHRYNKGRSNFDKVKHHLVQHKRKYVLAALATAVSTTAISLKVAKITMKPECRNGRRKCKGSEEDETEEDDVKPPTNSRKKHRIKSSAGSYRETGKESKRKDSKSKIDKTETPDKKENSKNNTQLDDEKRQ
ncbi:uncharacterized protein LOC142786711 isoform X2 [Rhipicephalus microplus]|uniref:uncharacterized protein LOC142786711 isoform X2 n=1 Tax=Rhipicephalus microplus TaxID=6941 RepID=UPI003F6ABED6